MMRILGWLILGGIVAYVLAYRAEVSAAEKVCASISAGTPLEHPEEIPGTFWLTLRGPLRIPEQADTERFVFCAAMTMCDVSCELEVTNDIVTEVVFRNL